MKRLLAATALLALTACIQFSGSELPELTLASLRTSKVTEVKYTFQTFSAFNDSAQRDLYNVVRSDMDDVFPGIVSPAANPPLHVDLEIGKTVELPELEKLWLGVTWPTAFVVPFYHETEYWLDARVSWQGKPLDRYRYEESIHLWAWLPLLPFMITNHVFARKPELELVDKMVLNFLRDLSVDLEALPEVMPPGE